MFLVRATEASKTKAVQVLTRIEETALLRHQLKLAYFVHIAETEANLAEFEFFGGKLYERTVLYTTSLAMLKPHLPRIYPEMPLLPQISSDTSSLAANVSNQDLAQAALILDQISSWNLIS